MEHMAADTGDRILVGRVSAPFGVRGWVRVYSYTEPRERIVQYNPWQLAMGHEWTGLRLLEGRRHGKSVVARLEGFEDVDDLSPLLGAEIAILRNQLPALGEQEFYWKDLLGLQVRTGEGVCLGWVHRMLETGANDVMVVKGDKEHLLPWVMGSVVKKVDIDAGVLEVDWDAQY
jgi:16S rRNA processing protein RimM